MQLKRGRLGVVHALHNLADGEVEEGLDGRPELRLCEEVEVLGDADVAGAQRGVEEFVAAGAAVACFGGQAAAAGWAEFAGGWVCGEVGAEGSFDGLDGGAEGLEAGANLDC